MLPRMSKVSLQNSLATKTAKRSRSEQKRKTEKFFNSISGSCQEEALQEELKAADQIKDDGEGSFPPFMHEELDEFNSVRFRVNE